MSKLHLYAASSAIAMAACFAASQADAQLIYAGGGSLAAKVYRQMYDCFGVPINGDGFTPVPGCPSTSGDLSGVAVQILYASVGSGAGKRAFVHNDGSTSPTTGLGSTPASVPQYTSTYQPTFGYPNFHIGGSDDPLTPSDILTYDSYVLPSGKTTAQVGGAPIQLPGMIVDVGIAFNGKDGNGNTLTIVNSTPTGGSSGFNLSRQAVCGIFSGHITQWNNSILTQLNGGTPLGSGQITVVHRSDGSGTSFITSNALVNQCIGVGGPYSETNSTNVSYAWPWLDTQSSPTCLFAEGSDLSAWPDEPGACPTPAVNPSAVFTNASGSQGVQTKVLTTPGSISYLSPDYLKPVQSSGPAAANVQSQYDITNSTGLFQPPTGAGAVVAMAEAVPSFNGTSVTNPLEWSQLGVRPNPQSGPNGSSPNAYPISGFTWIDLYQCYSSTGSEAGVLGDIQSYLTFHYNPNQGGAVMAANGFADIPGVYNDASTWVGAIYYLVAQSSSRFGANCPNGGV